MPALRLDEISIVRGATQTARALSAEFNAGQVYAILGPNGTGKSSLLKAIFGELSLSQGRIHYGPHPLSMRHLASWRQRIGYMPQGTEIDVSLTVLEVVLLGKLDALHMYVGDELLNEALEIMQQVGIVDLAHRDIQTLSGGQRQLAMFCQVLLRDPAIMLLDEPVSALDMHHQLNLLEQVHQETRQRRLITITVLHDLSLAAQFADQVMLLGEGVLQASGTPHDVLTPERLSPLYGVAVERLYDSAGIPVIRPLRQMNRGLVN
ncbi:iron ABC transporter ATP-binding protein [Terasakiispira papahanaumokuakeensis]|uniref:Iron ABC transporter ATP-binding protein n=2 Tax=Terasakiispira papahanaumokuakeensis TaxID=197479 RepID=A0A1E2VEB9_9GAMM|nr:iron ABC transporter ATP-binding protein [Terasakiispira papahanaumokuakeensis]